MSELLDVKNLSVSFHTERGEVEAVRNISFSVQRGQIVCLVGESGCGKSVTSKALMGLIFPPGEIKPESRIIYNGRNILDYTQREWYNYRGGICSMVFQDALTALNPTKKVGRQIAENLLIHYPKTSKEECQRKLVDILRKVGIQDPEQNKEKYPHQLSGGMRQRIMIAMAMITEPELMIADEATTALDVTIQIQILRLMKELQSSHDMSIVLITHNFGVVAEIADYIIVMYAGKIMEQGSLHDIFYQPRHPYTWALLKSVPRIDQPRDQKLTYIDGKPPQLIGIASGCPFFARCPYAMQICKHKMPDEFSIRPGHTSHCWLEHPASDKAGISYLNANPEEEVRHGK